jgi:hypothetical protein
MLCYNPTEQNCDKSLLFGMCCFHSEYLNWPWLVFITGCEFDKCRYFGNSCVELRHVSDIYSYFSGKWFLNPEGQHFRKYVTRINIGISVNEETYATYL